MRVKNAVQELKKGNNYKVLNERLEAVERKVMDEEFNSFLSL